VLPVTIRIYALSTMCAWMMVSETAFVLAPPMHVKLQGFVRRPRGQLVGVMVRVITRQIQALRVTMDWRAPMMINARITSHVAALSTCVISLPSAPQLKVQPVTVMAPVTIL
jgi:hypothetical protein